MKIKFSSSQLKVKKILERVKDDESKYAVIKCDFPDRFDAISLRKNKDHKVKEIALICFIPELYNSILEEDECSFNGFISFGYGSTFLVIDDFYSVKTGISWLNYQQSSPFEIE